MPRELFGFWVTGSTLLCVPVKHGVLDGNMVCAWVYSQSKLS